MKSSAALKSWLAERTPAQLTELLEQRDLPWAGAYGRDGVATPEQLADHLLSDISVSRGLQDICLADLQVLVAAARLAERLHGPLPAAVPPAAGSGHRHTPPFGYGRQAGRPADRDPAERAVPRAQLLEWLASRGDRREAAEASLRRLAERALVLPPHRAEVVVPPLVHRQVAELQGLGRPAASLLTDAYKAAEIHGIAGELGLPRSRTRDEAQHRITALLGDPQQLRAVVDAAPAEARELLDRLVAGPPLLRTRCFVTEYGYYAGPANTFRFRPGGSGDPGTDWLAARGLVVPVGTDLAELPYEVGQALREDDARPGFQPVPPPVDTLPLPRTASGQAQAAAAAAASRVELVLRAVAVQPLSVRKAGGIAVRDTRRLAKTIGADEGQTLLWLDLAANADLIAPYRDEEPPARRRRGTRPSPPPAARMLPTGRYDSWAAASPAARLLPLIATWAVTPEVFTYWPDPDETPVALSTPQDPVAVPLRLSLLDALAELPEGRGAALAAAGSLPPETLPEALEGLLARAAWYRPAAVAAGDETVRGRAWATLAEAGLLGVTAHGSLTPVGHAVRALLHAGAARHFPAVPGAGPALGSHPALAAAVRDLEQALADLLPEPRTTARFQADLTATVTGAASAELTDLLSGTADRESEGHAVVWRISAESVRRALDSGMDAADLLDRLSSVSEGGTPLPQSLEYLVKDTARTHGRMRVVRSACCIRSDDETLVAELSKARGLAKLGLRRIAPTVLVSSAAPDATLAALRAAGYAPVLETETGTTVIERAGGERAPATMPTLARARPHHGPGPRTAPDLAARLLAAR